LSDNSQFTNLVRIYERHNQLSNVEFVLGRESDPHLATSSLDLVLMAYSYHEFSEPEAMTKL
jgi:hypothetical protein